MKYSSVELSQVKLPLSPVNPMHALSPQLQSLGQIVRYLMSSMISHGATSEVQFGKSLAKIDVVKSNSVRLS